MTIVKDEASGLYYRDDMGELFIINEQSQYSGLDFEGRRVLDVGANIGAFTNFALNNGAAEVHCYEPTPGTYKVLRKNFGRNRKVKLNNIALTGSKDHNVELYIGKTYPATNTIRQVRGRDSVTVPAENFWTVVEKIRPDIVKVDIEGGEYEFMLQRNLPLFVTQFAIELHMSNASQQRKARELVERFSHWYAHRWFKLNWHIATMVVHRRKKSEMKISDVIKKWGTK